MGLQCFSHGFSFLRSGVTISGILGWLDSIPTEGKEIGARFHTIGLSDSAKVKFDRSIMSKISEMAVSIARKGSSSDTYSSPIPRI